MKSNKIALLLFAQNVITTVLFIIFLSAYKINTSNEIIITIVGLIYLIPTMLFSFLSMSGILANQPTKTITFGDNRSSSLYERLGKLFFAESLITGVAKKEFIDNNKGKMSKILGGSNNDVYELYGELNNLHGDYFKKEAAGQNNESVGFKLS